MARRSCCKWTTTTVIATRKKGSKRYRVRSGSGTAEWWVGKHLWCLGREQKEQGSTRKQMEIRFDSILQIWEKAESESVEWKEEICRDEWDPCNFFDGLWYRERLASWREDVKWRNGKFMNASNDVRWWDVCECGV